MKDKFDEIIKRIVDLEDNFEQEKADSLRAKLEHLLRTENQDIKNYKGQ